MIVFIVIILAMIGVFSLRLYKTQAVVTEESLVAADADSMTYQSTVEAARGNILDRNGNALVSNRASYNLVIVNFVFFNAPDPNGNLLKVLDLCDELGIQYESHFPVTPDRPYEYTDDNNSAWQENFRKFLADRGYDLDISAPTLMKRLRSEYKIPDDWKQADVYRIIAVRYELELRSIEGVGLENYTLAEDVDAESLAAVMELAVPGVVVENGTVREYNTKYAAHILGYIGPIWSAEADEYREKGYSMNALVGKSGVEQAFEQYLHGSSGLKKTTVSSTGEILNRYYVTEPVPGNNVELSIDISLQAVAEQSLEKVILDLRENGVGRNKEGKDARGGAVVVQACKTGEILAMASYPTYDISTFNQDYETLSEDEMNPLFNRALTAYPPGSVYKMVTSIAAVDLGGFLQVDRYRVKKAAHHKGAERNDERGVCQHQRNVRLQHMHLLHDHIQRYQKKNARNHLRQHHHEVRSLHDALAVVTAQRIAGQHRNDHGDERCGEGNDKAVLNIGKKAVIDQHATEVIDRWIVDQQRRNCRTDLILRFQCRNQHPEEWENTDDRQNADQNVGNGGNSRPCFFTAHFFRPFLSLPGC